MKSIECEHVYYVLIFTVVIRHKVNKNLESALNTVPTCACCKPLCTHAVCARQAVLHLQACFN